MIIEEGLSFNDVLLVPQHSAVFKDQIDLSCKLAKNLKLKIPLVASPMDTVTEQKMAIGLANLGGIGFLHRNLTISQQAGQAKAVKKIKGGKSAAVDQKNRLLVGAAVGVGEDLLPRLKALSKSEVDVIVLDSAHGHAQYILQTTKKIKEIYPAMPLVSGNVATAEGFENLARAGADAIRVGVGPGSICTTRIISGVGMPQVSAIMDCARVCRKYHVSLIADGGIQQAGDLTKALAAGAHTVMIGSLFARVDEAPGKTVTIKGRKYRYYRGMGSVAAMRKGSASRYGQGREDKKLIAEGVEGLVPYKGTLVDFVFQMLGGLRSGMEYLGAANLEDLYKKAKFIKITHAGLVESHPHDVLITNGGKNYHH